MPKKKIETELRNPPEGKRLTPEGRESQLTALAFDLLEQRLRDGTATSQEVTTMIRYGSLRGRLEREILEEEKRLKQAKTEAIEREKRIEALYADAIAAVKRYRGLTEEEEYYDEDIY